MPVRILRPTLRQSERWNRCSFFEQSFYIRLITIADDYGRYEAHPALLASECFPYGDADGLPVIATKVSGMLRSLASKDLLFVYESDGKQFFQLTRWKERIRLEKGSHYPDPEQAKIVWKCQSPDWQMSDRCLSDVGNPEIAEDAVNTTVIRNDSQMTVTCQQFPASPPTPVPTPTPTPTNRTSRFAPPSIDELELHGDKIGLPRGEVEKFQAYYESNGWRVGKNPMKCWKSAMSGWKTRWEEKTFRGNGSNQQEVESWQVKEARMLAKDAKQL